MAQQSSKEKRRMGPVVLAILDGWGIGPASSANAISRAKTPNLDEFQKKYPYTELQAHGRYVGLLPDQEGNSEAGHMNIGAGRIVRQDIVYVTEAIKDRTFFKNTAFMEALKHVKKYGTRVHILGLLSNGNSAHSSPLHLYALLELMEKEGIKEVFLHLFTDGRDSPPFSAHKLLRDLEQKLKPGQRIASIMGRFYAMDRNKLWQRTELAYNAIVNGEGLVAPSAAAAITHAYNRGESDEFIIPTVITGTTPPAPATVNDNDAMFFFNLRSDRARQLTKSLAQQDFEAKNDGAFARKRFPKNSRFVAMTGFGPDLPLVLTAFPSRDIENGLTETLKDVRQFYIGESEKYAHVTYFFNGGFADARFGEERMRVPSTFVPHHDSRPQMRAVEITNEVIRHIEHDLHDFIVVNYANADMVGHTGNMAATIEACEAVDAAIGKLAKSVLGAHGCLVITGDHGNAEAKLNTETGEVMTEHTANPVPFYAICSTIKKDKLGHGMLGDVAPTILDIMDIPKPEAMTGFSLLR